MFKIRTQYFLLVIVAFTSLKMNSQQVPNYTQYLYNMQVVNPAFVGYRAELSMSLLSREQWVGLPGAPTTRTFSINGRTRKGLGIGATVVNDKIGLTETTNVNADVSFTLITSRYSRLAFGLKGGVNFFTNNLANAVTVDNEVYNSLNGRFFNIGFGAVFYNRNFYVGLSVPHLLETPQFYIQDRNVQGRIAQNTNIFLSSGALFELTDKILFKPTTMIRYTASQPISIDFNANILYKEIIEAGLSYRYQNSISALFALIIKKKYRVGYSYDYKTTNVLGNLNTHEIILHFDFDFQRNTRWLRHNKCYF
nr:type IX secretion system membrane protein PorP/SprF [Polaribacter porphyrae]